MEMLWWCISGFNLIIKQCKELISASIIDLHPCKLDSFYLIPFLNKTKYMFDNLAYDDFILRSLKICNFRNVGVHFPFKTVG